MDTSGARVRVLPPLVFLAVLAVGLVLDWLLPLTIPGTGGVPLRLTSAVLLLAGLGVTAWAGASMHRARTTVSPWAAVSALVTAGPFRFTRNPIYLGDLLFYLGVSLWVGSWWPVLLLPLVFLAMQRLVIGPEERYLSARFGADYTAYRARVRRWL